MKTTLKQKLEIFDRTNFALREAKDEHDKAIKSLLSEVPNEANTFYRTGLEIYAVLRAKEGASTPIDWNVEVPYIFKKLDRDKP